MSVFSANPTIARQRSHSPTCFLTQSSLVSALVSLLQTRQLHFQGHGSGKTALVGSPVVRLILSNHHHFPERAASS